MSTTRRAALSAAVAAPLLTRFTGTASADAAAGTSALGTISDGWVEIHWTRVMQDELDRFGASVEAVPPARMVTDLRGSAVRFPIRSGTGDPSLADLPRAQGDGALDGGIAISMAGGTFRLTGLRGDLDGETASVKMLVDGVEVAHGSVLRCGLAEGVLTTESVPPGQPMKVRIAEVPLRFTDDLMTAYIAALGNPPLAAALGASGITRETVLAHLTAEGTYHPPTR